MATMVFTDEIFAHHDTGSSHPESAARLIAIEDALKEQKSDLLFERKLKAIDDLSLQLVHDANYINYLSSVVPKQDRIFLDGDTLLSPHSLTAARTACGGAVMAVDYALKSEDNNAFLLARPPGHHATPHRAMGFCIFNQAVMAVRHGLKKHHLTRAAIIDFDAHHGNGTQDCLWEDSQCFYGSIHQYPFYPGTGSLEERGKWNTIRNEPLPAESSPSLAHEAMERILAEMVRFAPELVVISAGFDAHLKDPLAMLRLEEEDFARLTSSILGAAQDCNARAVVSILEGGYNLEALAASATAHLLKLSEIT